MSDTEANHTIVPSAEEENSTPNAEQQQQHDDVPTAAPAAEAEAAAADDDNADDNAHAVVPAGDNHKSSTAVSAAMRANAIECAQSRRSQPRESAHNTHGASAMRYILSLSTATKAGDTSGTDGMIRALEEEDAQLFSEIPKELKPRKQQRSSEFGGGTSGGKTRRAEYHNENYCLPDKHEVCSPRRLVDVRRPLTARYDPMSPEARRARQEGSATSRYNGLAKGDLSCLENDPIYTPAPNSRRKEIEKAKDAERSRVVKPHSAAQLARRRGPPPKEATAEKKSADWYPALVNLAENSNAEGKQRRQLAQSRMSTHTFK